MVFRKLTEEQVLEMRKRYAKGRKYRTKYVSIEQLAREYGVSTFAVCQALLGRTWKHVGGPTHRSQKDRGWEWRDDKP